MPEWIEKLKAKPAIAHLLRAQERFGARLGSQFAAAIAYFSVLSLVPILMFCFALVGMTVTVLRPDLLDQVRGMIVAQLPGTSIGATIASVAEDALRSWQTIGIIGLAGFVWSGAGWVANLKSAVRGQLREDFDVGEHKSNLVVETLVNIAILIGLFVLMVVTFAASSAATALADTLAVWLRLDQVPGGGFLLLLVPLVVSVVTGAALFGFLYRVLPEKRLPGRPLLKASIAGALGLMALQYPATLLFGIFGRNPAAALFGPVIVLMLFLNLFATLVLILAAWIATREVAPAAAPAINPPEPRPEPAEPAPAMVSAAVAGKAMSVGLGAGWVLGTAAGVGIGAVVAGLLGALPRRRR